MNTGVGGQLRVECPSQQRAFPNQHRLPIHVHHNRGVLLCLAHRLLKQPIGIQTRHWWHIIAHAQQRKLTCIKLTDEQGHSLVQATDSIPSFIASLPRTIGHFLAQYPPETLRPGDVLITNDPWQGTGHLPDISVAKPIFFRGRLVGWSGSTAHSPDIGGKVRSPETREVFEEGLQIPIMKLLDAGTPNETASPAR